MAKFRAAVIGPGGRSDEVLEAPDRFAAYRALRERGSTVVELSEEGHRGGLSLAAVWGFANRISTDEKVILARNLSAMLTAGLTVSRALGVAERQTANRELKTVIGTVLADVKRGISFSAALAPFERVFSPLMVSMARAGEESGTLAESLRVVAVQMERASTLEKQVEGALIYPVIVLIAMILIAILLLVFVVPTLSKTFAEFGTTLPATTTFLMTVSAFVTGHPFSIPAVAVLAAAAAWLFARTRAGGRMVDRLLLRVPVIGGLVVETDCARAARTLASLLSAGVDMVLSLAITRDVVGNRSFKEALAEAEDAVVKGMPLSAALGRHPDLFPPLLSEMVAVGEETGRLSDLLGQTAAFYEASVERVAKDLSSVIEPLLILLVGGMVAFFALSVIEPIYSLSNSIG